MQIKFPVGDWSDDGHNQCEDFIAETPLTVEHVREAHFKAEANGIAIGQICSDYECASVDEDILAALDAAEIQYDDLPVDDMDPESVFTLWVRILNRVNPMLKLTAVTSVQIPSITFYGFDEQKRHLRSPGYGVFFD